MYPSAAGSLLNNSWICSIFMEYFRYFALRFSGTDACARQEAITGVSILDHSLGDSCPGQFTPYYCYSSIFDKQHEYCVYWLGDELSESLLLKITAVLLALLSKSASGPPPMDSSLVARRFLLFLSEFSSFSRLLLCNTLFSIFFFIIISFEPLNHGHVFRYSQQPLPRRLFPSIRY